MVWTEDLMVQACVDDALSPCAPVGFVLRSGLAQWRAQKADGSAVGESYASVAEARAAVEAAYESS